MKKMVENSMNGEYGNRQNPLDIETNAETLTGKVSANALIKQYQYVGHIDISPERTLVGKLE